MGVRKCNDTLRRFLQTYGHTLQHLAFDFMYGEDYDAFLEIAQQLKLERLDIQHEGPRFWHDYYHGTNTSLKVGAAQGILEKIRRDKFHWLRRMWSWALRCFSSRWKDTGQRPRSHRCRTLLMRRYKSPYILTSSLDNR